MLLCPWDSPGENTGVGCHALLWGRGLPNPGVEPRSPPLHADSLPSEPPGKPSLCSVLETLFRMSAGALQARSSLFSIRQGSLPFSVKGGKTFPLPS